MKFYRFEIDLIKKTSSFTKNYIMNDLYQMQCEACHLDTPTVTEPEQTLLLKEITNWVIVASEIPKLQRTFTFTNFVEAIDFTVKVGNLAEEFNHHPAILTEWGKVTVSWWTHSIRGLHKNDFILAAKTDRL